MFKLVEDHPTTKKLMQRIHQKRGIKMDFPMIDDNENALEKKSGLPENEQDYTTVNKLQLFTYIGIVSVPFGFLFSMAEHCLGPNRTI